jgi:large subunit ribosomal protein L20
MIRVKRGFVAVRRRKRLLKMASGYFGTRNRLFRVAKETVQRALSYAYRDRKTRKRFFRRLWIIRINAIARNYGSNYSKFIHYLKINDCIINRKILSLLLVHSPNTINSLISNSLACNK